MKLRVAPALLFMACRAFDAAPATMTEVDAGTIDSGTNLDAGNTTTEDAGECPDLVAVGTKEVSSLPDAIPNGFADTFGHFAPEATTARCAHVFLDVFKSNSSDPPVDVVLGVYSDKLQAPGVLLRQVRIKNVQPGWNKGRLDTPLALEQGQFVWLAVMSLGEGISSRVPTGEVCKHNPGVQHSLEVGSSDLPSSWNSASADPGQCNAALFLSP